jgi:hypothetical protein
MHIGDDAVRVMGTGEVERRCSRLRFECLMTTIAADSAEQFPFAGLLSTTKMSVVRKYGKLLPATWSRVASI